jgi:uncharacterized protein (TIGR03067 family)
MVQTRVTAALAALSLALPVLLADDRKGEDKTATPLKGIYTIVKGEKDGKVIPTDRIKGSVVTFTEKKVYGTDKDRKEVFAATYTLDTSRTPWVIRMTGTMPKKGEKADGIVEVDGDTLRICYALPGGKKPTGFKAGEKQHCFVLKRGVTAPAKKP